MIRIVTPAKRPELTKAPEGWQTSQNMTSIPCNGINGTCSTSDSDIAAIESMLGSSDQPMEQSADKITVAKSIGLRAPIAITPEKAAELMVANYCRQNGGVIVDNKKTNQVILG